MDSTSPTVTATNGSTFHFSSANSPTNLSPSDPPTSPLDASASAPAPPSPTSASSAAPQLATAKPYVRQELPAAFSPELASSTPITIPVNSTASVARPALSPRGQSFADDALSRRVSYAGQSLGMNDGAKDDIWGAGTRTLRAGSDGALLGVGALAARDLDATEPVEEESEEIYEQERLALFREHERRSLEASARSGANTAYNPPVISNPLASLGHSMGLLSPSSSDTAQLLQMQQQDGLNAQANGSGASLHLGDLDVWMDEAYVRECCARMGWEGVTNIKMIRGQSPSSGYCFLTFPTAAHAAQVLSRFASAPPMLMPRSARVFKLNWGTGLPGVQPRWEGEYSVFVGDLGREVGEAELVTLFTPLFASTKSAKIMYDPSTGISRGYGFVRFADENDMHRALTLGQNPGSGLSLHGRTLRISEASGPGNALDGNGRARSRNGDPLMIQTGGYQQQQYQPQHQQHQQYQQQHQQHPQQHQQDYNNSPMNSYAPSFGSQYGQMSPNVMRSPPAIGGYAYQQQQQLQQQQAPQHHTTDPNNTTVFVGGLPACISEETLKSFFHHFGEITYCKIPTGKGCGFVQFVRRPDAELAIAKMNDFPIHGKSRIRLSWGRSQGDKQVEHVRKLASALGVPFEAVWRMVQGQENQAMKQQHQQVANSISGNNGAPGPALLGSRFDALGMGRMELGAVATAAGLTEAEVMDLVGGRTESYGPTNGRGDEGFFTRSTIPHDSAAAAAAGAAGASGGPYSRVSPSTFSAFSGNDLTNPISPAPSSGGFAYNQQQPSNGSGPQYAMVNSNSYVQSPVSPYNAVPFVDGAPRSGSYQGYPQQNVNGAHQQAPYEYQQQQERPQTLEGSFENLGFNNVSGSSGPSSVGGGAVPGTGSAPASSVGGQPSEAGAVAGYLNPASAGAGEGLPNAGAQWGAWSGASGARDVQA